MNTAKQTTDQLNADVAAALTAARKHDADRLAKTRERTAEASAQQRAQAASTAIEPCATEASFAKIAADMRAFDPELKNPDIARTYGAAMENVRGYQAGRAILEHRAQQEAFAATRKKRRMLRDRLLDPASDVLVLALDSRSGVSIGDEVVMVNTIGWASPTEAADIRAALAKVPNPSLVLVEGDARFHLGASDRWNDAPSVLGAANVTNHRSHIGPWLEQIGCARTLVAWAYDGDTRLRGLVMHDASDGRGTTELARMCWAAAAKTGEMQEAIDFWTARLTPEVSGELVTAETEEEVSA